MDHPRKMTSTSHENSKTHAMAKKIKKRAIKKILRKESREKEDLETGALLPNGMPRKWRSCEFEGCDYRTQYKANLNRHQNHYGHRSIKNGQSIEGKKDMDALVSPNKNASIDPPQLPGLDDLNRKSSNDIVPSDAIGENRR